MCNDSASGYTMGSFRWLHGIFTQFVPGFSPYVTASPPTWDEVRDISQFAKLYNLYYRLLAIQHIFHTESIKSRAFLSSITEESLRPSIISLDTSIVNYNNNSALRDEFEPDGALPMHLTIDGLAASLIKSMTPLSNSLSMATHRTYAPVPLLPHGNDFSATFGSINYSSKPRGSPRSTLRKRIGSNESLSRGNDDPHTPPRRPPRTPRPTSGSNDDSTIVFCDECDEKHPVEKCWKVARALRVQRFIKRNLGRDILNKIEQAYSDHFGLRSSARANATSAAFLEAYCAETGLSGQEIADAFDWDWLASTVDDTDEPEESN
jgi:hypothetical protein